MKGNMVKYKETVEDLTKARDTLCNVRKQMESHTGRTAELLLELVDIIEAEMDEIDKKLDNL